MPNALHPKVKNNKPRLIGKRDRTGTVILAGMLLGACPVSSFAADFAYGLGYMGEHSDNITLASTNKQSDWIHTALAGFAYQENSADVVAHVLAQATYNTYQHNTFGDETLFDMDSYAVWTMSPQRLFWTVQDTYQQGLINSTGVDIPTNRTNLNVLSTGPNAYVRLSPVHTLAFGAQVGDVYTGQANADNKRFNGTTAWLYELSARTTLSLNYQILAVRYDDAVLNNDFSTQDRFFRVQYQPSRSQFTMDLGASHVNFDRGNDLDGTLARISWNRQANLESNYGATFSKEFSNTGTAILGATDTSVAAGSVPTPSDFTTATITADVFESKGGTVYYNRHSTLFGMQLLAGRRKLDYATEPLDNKETDGRLELDYFVSALTTATLYSQYTRTEYLDFFRRDTDQSTGLRLNYLLTRTVSVALQASRNQRRSTDPTLGYVDNRLLLSVLYSSGPLFAPLHRK